MAKVAAGPEKPRGLAGGIVKVLLFVVFFAVTMELCARIDDFLRYRAPFWSQYTSDRLRRRDAIGCTCNVPNARFEKWRHNSLGFRGPEVAREKRPGAARMVCVGASESYGLYESREKEWPAQLQAMLSPSDYEVINASVVGLNLRSLGAYLQKFVFPLRPDAVVLVINPLFYVVSLDDAGRGQETAAGRAARGEERTKPSCTESVIGNVRLLPKLKQVVKQGIAGNFPELFRKYEIASTGRQVREIERLRLHGAKPLDRVPDAYLAQFRKDLTHLVRITRLQNCDVILTSYPALISSGNISQHYEIFLDNRRFCIGYSLQGILDAFQRCNAVVADVSKEMNAPFVDAAGRIPKSTEYFGDNVHYTDKGASLFAHNVARALPGAAPDTLRRHSLQESR